jgi:hypothetical protein
MSAYLTLDYHFMLFCIFIANIHIFNKSVLMNFTLIDLKNRPVFTLHPQGEQVGFSAFIPTKSGTGKKLKKRVGF